MTVICNLVRSIERLLVAVLVAACIVATPQAIASAEEATAPASGSAASVASELAPLSSGDRAAVIGRLTDEQARDLLLYYLSDTAPAVPMEGDATSAAVSIETLRTKGTTIRNNLALLLGSSGRFIGEYGRLLDEKLGLTLGGGALVIIVLYILGLSASGAVVEYLFRYATRGMVAHNEARAAATVGERLARAFTRLLHDIGGIVAFAAGYAAAFLSIWGGNVERRDFTIVVLLAILVTRVTVAIVRFVFQPDQPAWRIMPVDDEGAAHFVRGTRRLAVLGSVLLLFGALGLMWGADTNVWGLGTLASGVIFTAAALAFLWRYRRHLLRSVDAAIVHDAVPRWAEDAAGWGWYVLAVGYVLATFLFGTYSLLLGTGFDPIRAAIGFFILFVANPYLTALATGLFAPDPDATGVATRPEVFVTDPDDGEAMSTRLATEAAIESSPAVIGDRRVLRRVISMAVLVFSLGLFALTIGIDVFSKAEEYPIAQFLLRILLNVGVVALLGYVGWALIAGSIDRKLAEEQARSPLPQSIDEGPAMQGGTRLQTILPIVRKFVQISIAVIAVMVVLASMGVNIGPLIAGAGVIGLAVGFGSQTLVKDLISGLFFLMDDAFRIGEYIEAGSVAGTVERFNARSLVLRGYLGAVYTVPYGDLGKVTNYSRDWVIMKLRFRVPYDTDIDLVRKIFKKIGEEMLEDPDLGPNFIQPFKSQGVIKMDDSAFIVSGKFMTKPNKQWGVRKAVYERVQQRFREYGIKFAPKRVIVDVPDAADMHDDDEIEKPHASQPTKRAAIAAAAAVAAEGKD